MKLDFRADVVAAAKSFGLEPKLVGALVMTESGGNQWAWNPEPRYHYLWDVKLHRPFRALTDQEASSSFPPDDFDAIRGDADQEWWGQKASWGLMQVMGAVARELGFVGPYLTELCDPMKNLIIGCRHLEQLMAWANGNAVQALAAYNGGKAGNDRVPFRNVAYADRVLTTQKVIEV